MGSRIIHSFFFASFVLTVTANSAEISVGRIDNAKAGDRKSVLISADNIATQISGFSLLVAYDQTLSLVYSVKPGELKNDYGWEYFSYRMITRDSLAVILPGYKVHLINIIGLASLSGNPPPLISGPSFVLAEIDVRLANILGSFSDETWTPFSFFWRDCRDNQLISVGGDTVYSGDEIFENRSASETHVPVNNVFPGYGAPDNPCLPSGTSEFTKSIDFVNSGIRSFVIDPTEECYNGDVNQNGIPYEVSDAVLFANYFICGICIQCDFVPCPWIEQTDCNCDETVLSVADLVCFIRKVTGEYWAGKLAVPVESEPTLFEDNSGNFRTFLLETNDELQLAYLKVIPTHSTNLSTINFESVNLNFKTGLIGDTTAMLLVDFEGNAVLSAGKHRLFEYAGDEDFEIEAWVVDMSGQEFALKLESAVVPESPELLQNYPNPFNPSTVIEFNLPANSEWKLEIYNVAGQLIKNYSGSSTGLTKIEWDGTEMSGTQVSSGVYFYKLISSDNISSRKMLLLK